jgi:cyanoexosortase B-associated protein
MTNSSFSAWLPSQRSPLYKFLVILFLLAIAAALAIPNYLAGNWVLHRVPELSNIQELRTLQQNGLSLPGWQTLEHRTVEMGGHRWSIQAIAPHSSDPADSPAYSSDPAPLLMLRPQTWHRDLPQVDWMDIRGAQHWQEDSDRMLQFPVVSSPDAAVSDAATIPSVVNARFLRSWTNQQTYAVLQWYAWNGGGDAAPSRWFWADQHSQLRDRQHLSWVAVSLLLPIAPLGDIETVRSQAEVLGQWVQSALMVDILKEN